MTARTILQVGNGRYPWCTEVHLRLSFQLLGHRVVFLQEDRQTPESIEEAAVQNEVDAVFYTRTWGLPSSLIDVWRNLEGRGIATASYHLDLYLGLDRQRTLANDPFWATQHVFTPDGDPVSQAQFESMGINHHYCPPAVLAAECVDGHRNARFAHDVVFVGSESYHPEWPWRPTLIEWLRTTYGQRFARYGAGAEVVRGQHLNDLYASAKVSVGDSLCPHFTKPLYVSDRLFEAIGRGSPLIFPRVPGIEDHLGFVDGEHCAFYEYADFDQIRELIDRYVDDQDEARAMAKRGQTFVRAHHTYDKRLAEALAIMGLT